MYALLQENGFKLLQENLSSLLLEGGILALYNTSFETSNQTLSGVQEWANYIILQCQPTGYQTIIFQPPENWEIEIPFLAKGENIFTVTAYNDSGQVTAEARTTYTPIVQIANSSIKVRPYIMTPQGPIPMNPRILKDGRIVQIETRMGASDGNAIVTGWSVGVKLGSVTAMPLNASAIITGWSVGVKLGSAIGSDGVINTASILTITDNSWPALTWKYTEYYTAPGGASVKTCVINISNLMGRPTTTKIFDQLSRELFSSSDIDYSGTVTFPTGVTAIRIGIRCDTGSYLSLQTSTIPTVTIG
jgi:hypothetical protein